MAVTLGGKPSKTKKRHIAAAAAALALLAIGAAAGLYARFLYMDYEAASDAYDGLASMHTRIDFEKAGGWDQPEPRPGQDPDEDREWRVTGKAGVDFPALDPDHSELYGINPDYMGWILIEDEVSDIHVSYPFVQGETNDAYLKRTMTGEKSAAGSVFVDHNTPGDFSDRHTILYGHNMLDGSMFSDLKKYLGTADEARERYFYIYLRDGSVLKCRVFSAHVVSKNSTVYQIKMSEKLYAEFFERVAGESDDDWGAADLIPDAIPEKTVTLSTCHGRSGTSRRMAVHAYIDTWYVDPEARAADIQDETEDAEHDDENIENGTGAAEQDPAGPGA